LGFLGPSNPLEGDKRSCESDRCGWLNLNLKNFENVNFAFKGNLRNFGD
jgi:hypothetical protein